MKPFAILGPWCQISDWLGVWQMKSCCLSGSLWPAPLCRGVHLMCAGRFAEHWDLLLLSSVKKAQKMKHWTPGTLKGYSIGAEVVVLDWSPGIFKGYSIGIEFIVLNWRPGMHCKWVWYA